jgi:signal transduction histidine kinase
MISICFMYTQAVSLLSALPCLAFLPLIFSNVCIYCFLDKVVRLDFDDIFSYFISSSPLGLSHTYSNFFSFIFPFLFNQINLLESKKSYVRYISHELRTPLNTAFLGLKLLTGELKSSRHPKDIERYDTLCDVNMSCMVAVDILNDLLCYEKLESGILELHKENIVVEPFLKDCVSMFSVQAREGDVKLTVDTEASDFDLPKTVSTDETTLVSLSLQPHDSIFGDKFKMDQVIRNIISNALKFTPREGSVKVKATFVYDTKQEASRVQQEPDVTRTIPPKSPARVDENVVRPDIQYILFYPISLLVFLHVIHSWSIIFPPSLLLCLRPNLFLSPSL